MDKKYNFAHSLIGKWWILVLILIRVVTAPTDTSLTGLPLADAIIFVVVAILLLYIYWNIKLNTK